MMWTTHALTFAPRHRLVLRSYLHHHPELRVKLYISDTGSWRLWSAHLRDLLDQGYQLELVPLTRSLLTELTRDGRCGPAAEHWVQDIDANEAGRYYYSHLTDLLRFCLLWQEGGIYSDFDAILLRPLALQLWFGGRGAPSLVVGKDRIGRDEFCDWCLAGGRHYLAPGVMIAKRGAPVLQLALEAAFTNYDPNVFNAAGPKALTVASRIAPRDSMLILEPEVLYPLNYLEASQLFQKSPHAAAGADAQTLLEGMERGGALSVHFFGAQTRGMIIQEGSVLDLISHRLLGKSPWLLPDYIKLVEAAGDLGIRWAGPQPPPHVRLWAGDAIVAECSEASVARLNACLSRIRLDKVQHSDAVKLRVEAPGIVDASVPVYNLARLLTITVKTMDRLYKVVPLVDSLRRLYPQEAISVLVSNDGSRASDIAEGPQRGFTYLSLPFDVGLSAARNLMLHKVETPLVMILDDDFEFTQHSDLYYLVHNLYWHGLDIVAATSPADHSTHGIDYSGLMTVEGATLSITTGRHGRLGGSTCDLVDIVPNIFVARLEALQDRIGGWDAQLKLGEHEDFFLRAKRAGVRVAICRSVALLHKQEKHWLKQTAYDRMRARVWQYLQAALLRHGLRRLRAFGMITMALQPISIDDISRVRVYDLQPFAVGFEWQSRSPYHLYQIDVYDITDCASDLEPGQLWLTSFVEASSPAEPVAPCYAQVNGLDPDRYYRLVLRPGNHTHVHPPEEDCPELIVRTPDFWRNNLVINGDFASDDEYWRGTLGTRYTLVPIHGTTPSAGLDHLEGGGVPVRAGHFSRALLAAGPLGDFAVSIYTPLPRQDPPGSAVEGGGRLSDPAEYGILQWIPAAELVPPSSLISGPQTVQLSVSAWCLVNRLFGPPSQVSIRLMLRARWQGGRVQSWWENWDPYEEHKWQPLAFSIGLQISAALLGVEVIAWMRAPGGSIFLDDFYLAARPIAEGKGFLGDGSEGESCQ